MYLALRYDAEIQVGVRLQQRTPDLVARLLFAKERKPSTYEATKKEATFRDKSLIHSLMSWPSASTVLIGTAVTLAPVTLALGAAAWLLLRDDLVDEKGSARGSKKALDDFIMRVCGGQDGFSRSLMRWSFVRASLNRLGSDINDTLSGALRKVAREGKAWPDAEVFELGELDDGKFSSDAAADASSGRLTQASKAISRRLHSYLPSARGRPLVLNFGSWT